MKENKELTILQEGLVYDQEQINLIKNTVAVGATNNELDMFLYLAKQYDLDPFKKEIWFVKYKDKTNIITSRDGYLKYAQTSPEFEGLISFPVREGDVFEIDAEAYKVTHKFGAKRGRILGAWARCDRKGKKPFLAYAEFAEYNNSNSNIWQKYPSAMIQKIAEVFVLKRAFGISGLVTQEELNIQKEEETPDKDPKKSLPKEPVKDNVVQIEKHKAEKKQKEEIMDLATRKGLIVWQDKNHVNTNKLKAYCMKELNVPLSELSYEEANTLLNKLNEYVPAVVEVEKVNAEIVEVDGVELTEEEKKTIENFTQAK